MARHDAAVGRYVYLTINDVEYRVYYESNGSGIPLICQHTAGAHGFQWRHLLEDPQPILGQPGTELVPPALAAVVERCLAKDPADRPRTADELRIQLLIACDRRRQNLSGAVQLPPAGVSSVWVEAPTALDAPPAAATNPPRAKDADTAPQPTVTRPADAASSSAAPAPERDPWGFPDPGSLSPAGAMLAALGDGHGPTLVETPRALLDEHPLAGSPSEPFPLPGFDQPQTEADDFPTGVKPALTARDRPRVDAMPPASSAGSAAMPLPWWGLGLAVLAGLATLAALLLWKL